MGRSNPSLLRDRWMMMVAGVWVMVSSGTSYLYSDYSSAIKSTLHYDQQTLDTVGFFKEVGESVGLVSGLLYDVFPVWAVLLVGALQCSGGYLMAYLAVSGALGPPPVWAMSLFLCVGANGQTFFITAALVSVVKRFPMSKGLVIGIMKGLVGLSAAVLMQFATALYAKAESQGKSVLLFLGWFPSFVVAVSYIFFRSQPTADDGHGDAEAEYEENEPLYFSLFAGLMLSLAAFLMGIITLQNTVGAFPELLTRGAAFVTLLLLLLPLGIVYVSRISTRHGKDCTTEPLLCSAAATPAEAPDCTSYGTFPDSSTITRIDSFQREFPARGEDHTLPQALRNWDFWLLVAIAMIGMGSGLTAMDNVAQVGGSLGYSESAINSFVSMVSISNFLGRLGAGAVSELALHQRGLPRPLFLMGALSALALGHAILALAFPGALVIGSVLVGLSYGAHWSLVPTATSELFGLRHFGTLLNAVTMASPVGSYVLSVRVAGFFYDVEARKQGIHGFPDANANETLSCSGAVCFRLTFVVMAVICGMGCGLCALLVVRTRKFYTDVVYEACQVRSHHSRAVSRRGRRDDDEQPAASSTGA